MLPLAFAGRVRKPCCRSEKRTASGSFGKRMQRSMCAAQRAFPPSMRALDERQGAVTMSRVTALPDAAALAQRQCYKDE